ncbi:MAG: MFS transporter [Phycisphaeraceae bacterium]|nr:MFS transporter [Phycisphaeraceae bacterium]
MASHRMVLIRLALYPCLMASMFVYPVYSILFQSRGMSILQISLLLTWWSLSSALLEVPSGALADHWSRRGLLLWAPLVDLASLVIWYWAGDSFLLLALGFLLWSISGTSMSGTFEALLYDQLAVWGRQCEYEKIRGCQLFLKSWAYGAASVAGGLIAHWNMEAVLLFSMVPLLLAFVVALTLTDPPRVHLVSGSRYLSHIADAWREVCFNHAFRQALVFLLLTADVLGVMDEYDPLYYTLVGVPLYLLGGLMAVRAVVESSGKLLACRLGRRPILEWLIPAAVGLLLVIVGLYPCKIMTCLIILSYFMLSPLEVIMEGRLQRSISSASRATTLSAASLINEAFGLSLMVMTGLIARSWGLGGCYVCFGLILLIFPIALIARARFRRRRKR